MLFNSYPFIFLFLPIVLLVFFALGERNRKKLALTWLVAASLFFYGWWNPVYLGLLILSILFNYVIGLYLSQPIASKKALLTFGIIANLALLAYYKYANFFVDSVNSLGGMAFNLQTIILPLGISFFTFTQIAYLVDTYRGEITLLNKSSADGFLKYCLFVTFFPHLIAGPVVHHRDILPQFDKDSMYQWNQADVAMGLTIFSLGLFKKGVLADGIAVYATPVFEMAAKGVPLNFLEAWGGAIAYSLQLYFDFSGYCDMAIGASLLFGIRLPINFNSPYKAVNIIDFWRRWHITLSKFLRDYLYVPLGGNRKGSTRRYANLMTTMLLGGLWHGAGWTFVVWGGLHGLYLVINHSWRSLRQTLGQDLNHSSLFGKISASTLTFLAVVVAWVFFRAKDLQAALVMLAGMGGLHGFVLPESLGPSLGALKPLLERGGVTFIFPNLDATSLVSTYLWIGMLLPLVFLFPNTQQWTAYREFEAKLPAKVEYSFWKPILWKPSQPWAVAVAMITTLGMLNLSKVSEFLYFQF